MAEMKVAYIIESMFNSGGMERVLSVCANALCQKLDISIITLCQKESPPFFTLHDRISCFDLGLDDVANRSLLKKRLSVFFVAHHFDIVVSLGGIDLYYLHSIKDGSKKVVWFHFAIDIAKTTWVGPNPTMLSRIKAQLQTWRRIYSACQYDRIVVISKTDLEKWKRYTKKAVLIYNPVTIDKPVLSNRQQKAVISVGRLDYQKGFDFLIDAWKIIAEKYPDWHLDIYGEGSLRSQLQQQIDNMNLTSIVSLCGRSQKIDVEYGEHSIYVMSSRAEGFPLVLLEAASCGLPVISFDCPSGPNEIVEDGYNGFLISKVGDVKSLASRIESLIEDEAMRRRLGDNALKTTERFSVTNIITEWIRLFEAVN